MQLICKFFFLACVLFSFPANAQNRASCLLGDTLNFFVTHDRGDIVWQQSNNNVSWGVIPNLSSDTLTIVPPVQTYYVRSVIDEDNCPLNFNPSFKITAVDTSSATHESSIFHIGQFPFTSINQLDGLFVLGLTDFDFPFQAGDLLGGVEGVETLFFIETVIVQDNSALVFVAETQMSANVMPIILGSLTQAQVMGRVLDMNGSVVKYANVKIGRDQTLTDEHGVFIFENADVFEKLGYVQVSKMGLDVSSRSFIPKPGGNVLEIRLLPQVEFDNYFGNQEANLSLADFELTIPANSLFNNSHSPYPYEFSYHLKTIHRNSEHFFSEMPGNLWGNLQDNLVGIISYGIINIEILDLWGDALNFLPGQFISLKTQISEELISVAPDTIDLWMFDEELGIWNNAAKALKIDDYYLAEVNESGIYNFGIPFQPRLLTGSLSEENGLWLSGIHVNVSNPNTAINADISNVLGEFTALVPSNSALNIDLNIVFFNQEQVQLVTNFPIQITNQDTSVLIENIPLPDLKLVTGTASSCNNEPLNNGYLLGSSTISFVTDGIFSYVGNLVSDSIAIVKNYPLQSSGFESYNLINGVNDIGLFILCQEEILAGNFIEDIDGNVYRTVIIGNQTWMAENLKTTHYADGSLIPQIIEPNAWNFITTGAWCKSIAGEGYNHVFGKIYNGFTVASPRNACPENWHVPSLDDWDELLSALGGAPEAVEKLKTNFGWDGILGSGTNESGFSALPSGSVFYPEMSNQIGQAAFFASTSIEEGSSIETIWLNANFLITETYQVDLNRGISIRCVQD
ncbi:MAG: FISUMP domain-containing protein [Bacteroidia bacterium]